MMIVGAPRIFWVSGRGWNHQSTRLPEVYIKNFPVEWEEEKPRRRWQRGEHSAPFGLKYVAKYLQMAISTGKISVFLLKMIFKCLTIKFWGSLFSATPLGKILMWVFLQDKIKEEFGKSGKVLTPGPSFSVVRVLPRDTIYIYISIYLYIYLSIYICISISIYLYIYIHTHVCII